MLDVTLVFSSIKNVIDREELYEEFEIDNEPIVGNINDVNTKGVEQGKHPP